MRYADGNGGPVVRTVTADTAKAEDISFDELDLADSAACQERCKRR
jgi:hypothetical protein